MIGAGPIGLEAALYARQLGFEVEILEKRFVGANISHWGHVRLFSPWKMNHSALGVKLLKENFDKWQEPTQEAFLTGREYVESYLQPLSQLPQIAQNLHTGIEVLSVGRARVLKGELIGNPQRANHSFRLLTRDASGEEKIFHADIVIDATGVYGTPNWIGEGGIPAVGERRARPFIDYHLRDIYGADRAKFAGKKTLLIGAGYSAATTICDFQNLIREEPETSVIWVIRENRTEPIPVIEDDALPNRASLTRTANAIAQNGETQIAFRNKTVIHSIEYIENEAQFLVLLKFGNSKEEIKVHRIIANVGYGPDNSLYRELQVHECYATRGPMNLAAALLGSASADCLTQASQGAETLKNPEPDFYIIGNKSYGRNSTFLIRVGLSQIVEVFSLITGNNHLNLYEDIHQKVSVK